MLSKMDSISSSSCSWLAGWSSSSVVWFRCPASFCSTGPITIELLDNVTQQYLDYDVTEISHHSSGWCFLPPTWSWRLLMSSRSRALRNKLLLVDKPSSSTSLDRRLTWPMRRHKCESGALFLFFTKHLNHCSRPNWCMREGTQVCSGVSTCCSRALRPEVTWLKSSSTLDSSTPELFCDITTWTHKRLTTTRI